MAGRAANGDLMSRSCWLQAVDEADEALAVEQIDGGVFVPTTWSTATPPRPTRPRTSSSSMVDVEHGDADGQFDGGLHARQRRRCAACA